MNTTPAKPMRLRFARLSLVAGIALTAITLALLMFWLFYQPDSHSVFYCTLGDAANCALVQQAQANRLVVYYTMVSTGLLALVSYCAAALCRWVML